MFLLSLFYFFISNLPATVPKLKLNHTDNTSVTSTETTDKGGKRVTPENGYLLILQPLTNTHVNCSCFPGHSNSCVGVRDPFPKEKSSVMCVGYVCYAHYNTNCTPLPEVHGPGNVRHRGKGKLDTEAR